jgi:PAS domain-containing protein
MTPYTLALELTALLAFWVGLGAWQHGREVPARLPFVGLALAVLAWCAGEIFTARGWVAPWTGAEIKYLGIVTLAPLWFAVSVHMARLEIGRRLPYLPLALMLPGLFVYSLLFLGPWAALFLPPGAYTQGGRGPLWWVHAFYAYALVVSGTAMQLSAAIRGRRAGGPGRWRWLSIGVASLLPLAGNAAYIATGRSWSHDPTPLLIGVTLLALRSAVFSGGLLEVLPVAQRDLIDHLPFGVVLADRFGAVIDVNPAAERRLGMLRRDALGRALEAVLAFAPPGTPVETTGVEVRGREVARFALLDLPAPAARLGPLTPEDVAA